MVLFIILLYLHSFMNFANDDVTYFANQFDQFNWLNFLEMRYKVWISRIIIESFLIFISRNIFLWRILDSFIFCLLIYSICSLLFKKISWKSILLVSLNCFIYPFLSMEEADFCATTMNYLWPLTFMLFSFIPLKRIFYHQKINKKMLPIYIFYLIMF